MIFEEVKALGRKYQMLRDLLQRAGGLKVTSFRACMRNFYSVMGNSNYTFH